MKIRSKYNYFKRASLFVSTLFFLSASTISQFSSSSAALTQNPQPSAKVSFTFDDGLASAYSQAAPILQKYGFSGTAYVTTDCIGMTSAPNTCQADEDAAYMNWDQVKSLQQSYGWEIGSHTASHPFLATYDIYDDESVPLTNEQVIDELVSSKSALTSQGINANALSTPYGDYNVFTLQEIAKLYTSHRGFADTNRNVWPYNDYLLNNTPVQVGVSFNEVKASIDQAIANSDWEILTLHDILVNPSSDPDDYQYSSANLDRIAAYVKQKELAGQLEVVTVSEGLVTGDNNLMQNGSFQDDFAASGWRTDNSTTISIDNNSGSAPEPSKSVKLRSSSRTAHLFSPKIPVRSTDTYLIKQYLNVSSLNSGEVGFYIDEYDVNGDWISGQYKVSEKSVYVENLNFTYKPSSNDVSSASLQVFVTPNSGITAYLDNVSWLALTTTPVLEENLMPNHTFDRGISGGWATDDSQLITADFANNGAPGGSTSSVSLRSPNLSQNKHLFSPQINVEHTTRYAVSSFIDIKQLLRGEVGFYIDEYDSQGGWVSGQYVASANTIGKNDIAFSYTPSSSSVSKASLQIIVVGNSGLNAYFDHVMWRATN